MIVDRFAERVFEAKIKAGLGLMVISGNQRVIGRVAVEVRRQQATVPGIGASGRIASQVGADAALIAFVTMLLVVARCAHIRQFDQISGANRMLDGEVPLVHVRCTVTGPQQKCGCASGQP